MPDEKEIPKDPRKPEPENRVAAGDEKCSKPSVKKKKSKKK